MIGLRYLRNDLVRATQCVKPYSTNSSSKTVAIKEYLKEPVKLIVIPVTTKKVYVYHKHSKDLLNDDSRLIRLERWVNRKSGDIWMKLQKSSKSYNQKIVGFVNRLLDNITWTESSLRSIPGERYILKRVSKSGEETKLTLQQFITSKTTLEPTPLNVYYPSKSLTKGSVLMELQNFYSSGLKYHKKQFLLCLLGLPLTLPVILVPIVPNVPGFYLAYRAYCNFKALLGAKHLQTILQDNIPPLQFRSIEGYSEIISENNTVSDLRSQDADNAIEKLLLNEERMARILDLLEIHELEPELRKAITQERRRLQNSI